MDGFWVIILIAFGVVVVIALFLTISDNKYVDAVKEYVNEVKNNTTDFSFDKFIDAVIYCDRIIAVDNTQRKVRLYKFSDKSSVTYNYEDIIGVEIIKNGSSVASRSLSRTVGGTIVGGMLGGVAGAIVGGTTGDQSITSHLYDLRVKVTLRSLQNTSEVFTLMDCTPESVKDSDFITDKTFLKEAEEIKDVFSVIIDDVEQKYKASILENTTRVVESAKLEPTGSVADELVKLADLKAKGLLSEEEYEAAKQKVLSH